MRLVFDPVRGGRERSRRRGLRRLRHPGNATPAAAVRSRRLRGELDAPLAVTEPDGFDLALAQPLLDVRHDRGQRVLVADQ